MKNFNFNFLIFTFLIFPACEDLSFNEDDFISPEIAPVQEIPIPKIENEVSEQIPEEEVTILSEDLELSENLVIQDKKVVLDMVTIQTLQYDLTIIADEFIPNHSFIRNFPEEQTAKDKEIGRSGGHVLIKAKTAKGSLGLILSGENGGYVHKRPISRRERDKLAGRNGESGYNAIYDTWCRDIYLPLGLGIIPANIVIDRDCWQECRVNPTRGQAGEDGRQGFPGYDGMKGGNSGSFYLQAFILSDFHLTEVQKKFGLGSKGGKGSAGGYGGERGKNGRDIEGLCSSNFPRPKRGRKGYRGKKGTDGENGTEGIVCLENLNNQQAQSNTNQKPLEANNNQAKTEIKCNDAGAGVMCREVLSEGNEINNKVQKENVICY